MSQNTTNQSIKSNSPSKPSLSHRSSRTTLNSNLSPSNLVSNDSNSIASTPYSLDPNDEIWIEFLNSLNDPQNLNQNVASNKSNSNQSKEVNQSENRDCLNDNDDVSDDPDFTVCLENYDFDDPDNMEEWLQIPSLIFIKFE